MKGEFICFLPAKQAIGLDALGLPIASFKVAGMAAGCLVFQESAQICHVFLEVGECRAGHEVHIHLGHWHSQLMHTCGTLQSWPLAQAIPWHEQVLRAVSLLTSLLAQGCVAAGCLSSQCHVAVA